MFNENHSRLRAAGLAPILALLLLSGAARAALLTGPFDFSYSYANPYDTAAQTYIDSIVNATLYSEGTVRMYIPVVGGATQATAPAGVITYKFDFGTETVSGANLRTNNPTFHWSYSEGHNYFYGSKDGSTWIELLDVTTPAFGSANSGVFNDALPASLLGGSELWFKAELFSYGPSVTCCGAAGRNTAQHSRWDTSAGSTAETFKLQVIFDDDDGGTVPAPATLALFGLGLAGLGWSRRKPR